MSPSFYYIGQTPSVAGLPPVWDGFNYPSISYSNSYGAYNGTAQVTNNGGWLNSPTSFTYEWRRGVQASIDGTPFAAPDTNSSVIVTSTNVPLSFRSSTGIAVLVTAHNAFGSSAAVISNMYPITNNNRALVMYPPLWNNEVSYNTGDIIDMTDFGQSLGHSDGAGFDLYNVVRASGNNLIQSLGGNTAFPVPASIGDPYKLLCIDTTTPSGGLRKIAESNFHYTNYYGSTFFRGTISGSLSPGSVLTIGDPGTVNVPSGGTIIPREYFSRWLVAGLTVENQGDTVTVLPQWRGWPIYSAVNWGELPFSGQSTEVPTQRRDIPN